MTQNPTQVYSIQINNEVRRYLQLSVSQGVMQTLLEVSVRAEPEEVQRTALCVFDFGRITSDLGESKRAAKFKGTAHQRHSRRSPPRRQDSKGPVGQQSLCPPGHCEEDHQPTQLLITSGIFDPGLRLKTDPPPGEDTVTKDETDSVDRTPLASLLGETEYTANGDPVNQLLQKDERIGWGRILSPPLLGTVRYGASWRDAASARRRLSPELASVIGRQLAAHAVTGSWIRNTWLKWFGR